MCAQPRKLHLHRGAVVLESAYNLNLPQGSTRQQPITVLCPPPIDQLRIDHRHAWTDQSGSEILLWRDERGDRQDQGIASATLRRRSRYGALSGKRCLQRADVFAQRRVQAFVEQVVEGAIYLLDENVLRELHPGGNPHVRGWYAY
jgi:hypothetical protein